MPRVGVPPPILEEGQEGILEEDDEGDSPQGEG